MGRKVAIGLACLLLISSMGVTVITLPGRNPEIAKDVTVLPNRAIQVPLASVGIVLLGTFLVVHVWKDLNADVAAWYFHSTPLWVGVMVLASVIYFKEVTALKRTGLDTDAHFLTLPPE